MITQVVQEIAKKVPTFDLQGKENGFLMELFKDGDKTIAYLSAALPGAFKGYHLHRIRAARYVCLKGSMKIILYINGVREEHTLNVGDRLFIPKETPTGLLNEGSEEAWLINYPDPPYDPNLKDEQVDYTEEELKSGVRK
jgi:mannose-6-phosphate isomerase-like protein (cupin superfamily)